MIVASALIAFAAQAPGARLELAQTLAPGFAVSDQRLVDLDQVDAGGRTELVLLGRAGELRVFAHDPKPPEAAVGAPLLDPIAKGDAMLPDPSRALVDLAQLGDRPGLDAIQLGPRDTRVWPRDGARFATEPVVLSRRANHSLRVGAPRFVDIAQDVNGDGRVDLVVPGVRSLRLWLGGPPDSAGEPGWPSFQAAATLAVDVSRSQDMDGDDLSDVLSSSFSIPALSARDVNGDGRDDLLVSQGVVRAFHLQRADATFPEAPDVRVDLSIFRDTVEAAKLRPGHTLAVGDGATYESRDLDGDGIPDYVIAHRRKVWVFHGTKAGPQFKEPASVLKTSDDITALQLVRLDGDDRPDLLLVKVQVPTIAALVRGIFGEWDVEVGAAGYLSKPGGSFESTPSKRAELSVRLPAILKLIRDPASFLKRFEEIGARFRRSVWGDFDGNGQRDVVLIRADASELELWTSNVPDAKTAALDGEALLSQVLFEDTRRVWDVDRIAGWLGGIADRRTAELTGGRARDASFPLRPVDEAKLESIDAADFDGDGREELLLGYRRIADGATLFDLLRLAP